MKWTNFFMMAILGIGLAMTACSNDDNDGDPNKGGVNPAMGGDAYLSLNINMGYGGAPKFPATKAAGDVEYGTAAEQAIDKIYLVLYSTATGKVEQQILLNATTDGTNAFKGNDVSSVGTPTKSKFNTKGIKVKNQNYEVLVLANPTNAIITATAIGSTKGSFEAAATNVAPSDFYTTTSNSDPTNFYMANASGFIIVTTGNLHPDAATAESLPVGPINIERSLAKITVLAKGGSLSNIVTPEGGRVEAIKWTSNNINKNVYWRRHLTNKLDNGNYGTTSTAASVLMETVADYNNNDRYDLYAQDPNFTGDASSNMDNKTAATAITSIIGTGFEYVTENTMQAADQLIKNSTGILIQVQYTPSDTAIIPGADFYTINGTIYSQVKMTQFVTDNAGAGITDPIIKEAVQAALAAGHTLDGTDANAFSSTSATNKYTLNYYKEGYMYYQIPIRHFDDTQQPKLMEYGRYGIVRNNLYKIIINRIAMGSPTVPATNTNDPDDREFYLSVGIDVAPWFVRNQNIDI